MRRKKILICFTGIDGSGKTSLANSAVQILKEQGVSARQVWGAHQMWLLKPFVQLGMMIFLHHSLKDIYKDYTGYYSSIKKASRRRVLVSVYQNWALLEYFLQVLLKVRIPLMFGKSIVCDRYIYDTMVQLHVNLGYTKDELRSKLARVARFYPAARMTFFVDVPEEVAYQRKGDIPSVEYLKLRREAYLSILDAPGVIKLDGTRDPGELRGIVRGKIIQYLTGVHSA